jgi:hypothetical protein
MRMRSRVGLLGWSSDIIGINKCYSRERRVFWASGNGSGEGVEEIF